MPARKNSPQLAGGIMSGTSLDGIDAVVIALDGPRVETLAFHTAPYPPGLRQALLAVSDTPTHTREIARLHYLLPELYAEAFLEACRKARVKPAQVAVLGCHGQTIYHQGTPEPFLGRRIACTLQIGDGSVLAARTGVPVVCDFRAADIAAGGQGAPLVPYVDYLLLRDETESRVALNIGGIANITYLPAGCRPQDVIAFDTGPGNMVIDQLMAHFTGGRESFDRGGAFAARGSVHPEVVEQLLDDEYFRRRPPKSCGREQYGAEFVRRFLAFGLPPEDAVATATYFTAAAVAEGIASFAGGEDDPPARVIVSGGGVHNRTLLRFLRAELPDSEVVRSEIFGIDPDAKEAIAFAVLALETLEGRPANLPTATGARRPAILGKLCRP
jgi:anhydro-N-acetylmuramic acid kinase